MPSLPKFECRKCGKKKTAGMSDGIKFLADPGYHITCKCGQYMHVLDPDGKWKQKEIEERRKAGQQVPEPEPEPEPSAEEGVPLALNTHQATRGFPARAFIQADFLPEVRDELLARGVPVVVLQTSVGDADWAAQLKRELALAKLSSTDLVVALPSLVDLALGELGIPVPEPPDYPSCLQHLLRRKVWRSTLKGVQTQLASGEAPQSMFIKPAEGAKGFSGTLVKGPADDMLNMLLDASIFPSLYPEMPVHCSEVVEMNSEYAVYVVDGVVRATCHYMCKQSTCRCSNGEKFLSGEASAVELDASVVEQAVGLLSASEETRTLCGYRADFALVRTAGGEDGETFETGLVEVNDGYVSGRYEGMPAKDFTDMIVARFAALQSAAAEAVQQSTIEIGGA
jgi:hypothetical protein